MAIFDQGTQQGAKQGTVYLGVGGPAFNVLNQDVSQDLTNMTNNGTGMSESPTTRYDRSHPRTIHACVQVDTTSTGTIFFQGTGGTETALRLDGAGNLLVVHEGATIQTIAIDGLTATRSDYEIAWVSEANPDTTGAANAVASWVLIWDDAPDVAQRVGPFLHTVKTADGNGASWGEDLGGGNVLNESMLRVAFHHRAQTLAEITQDWIATEPTPATLAAIEREPVPLTVASGAGARNELQGPVGAWGAHHMRRLRRRTVTGRAVRLADVELDRTFPTGNEAVRFAVGSDDFYMLQGWLFEVPVAPTVGHLWVRLHVDSWVTAGAAVPLGLRAYSCSKPPQLAQPGGETFEQSFVALKVTRDDTGAGLGVWEELGPLPVRRSTTGDRRGWTYVVLAFAIDPDAESLNDAAARAIINAVQLVPMYKTPVAGELLEGAGEG